MPQLVLHSASPIAPPFPSNIERTVTLPFLTRLDTSASSGDRALALSHLVLPALTQLRITTRSVHPDGGDELKFLWYFVQHSQRLQDTQPLRTMLIHGGRKYMRILAGHDTDTKEYIWTAVPCLALSVTCRDWWFPDTYYLILDEAIAVLPLTNLVKLTAENQTLLDKEFWLYHAPRWSLLKCVRLCPIAARGLREMILEDNGGRKCPLLPSLTILHLLENTLTVRRTLRLCDALMKRVEQGVPLEELDLHTCNVTSHAVQLLSEVVASVYSLGALYSHTLPDDDSGAEDNLDAYYESESDDDEEEDESEMDDEGEEEEDYLVAEEG